MEIIEIQSLNQPEVAIFSSLTEHQLRREADGDGIFIAESPKVIKVALEAGYSPISILCERKHIEGDTADILSSCPGIKVFTGNRETLASLTGYTLTRGVLCAMRRKPLPDIAEICSFASRLAVIEAVCDTTNIGSIFRSASALGIDGIILTPDSCDPLNRRAVRVSMGTVFKIPWTFSPDPVTEIKSYGFKTIALALHKDSIPIDSPILQNHPKIAMFLGTEGDGLSYSIISKCDYKAIIPMHHGTDSLNVGAAAAVAFWQLSK